jgi:hypothetical protein
MCALFSHIQRLFATFLVPFNKWPVTCRLPSRHARIKVPIFVCPISFFPLIKLDFSKSSSRDCQYQVSWKSALVSEFWHSDRRIRRICSHIFVASLLNKPEKLPAMHLCKKWRLQVFYLHGDSIFLRKAGTTVQQYTVLQPTKAQSTSSTTWKPQVRYFGQRVIQLLQAPFIWSTHLLPNLPMTPGYGQVYVHRHVISNALRKLQ